MARKRFATKVNMFDLNQINLIFRQKVLKFQNLLYTVFDG